MIIDFNTFTGGRFPYRMFDADGWEFDAPVCKCDTKTGDVWITTKDREGRVVEYPEGEIFLAHAKLKAPLKLIDADGVEVTGIKVDDFLTTTNMQNREFITKQPKKTASD